MGVGGEINMFLFMKSPKHPNLEGGSHQPLPYAFSGAALPETRRKSLHPLKCSVPAFTLPELGCFTPF